LRCQLAQAVSLRVGRADTSASHIENGQALDHSLTLNGGSGWELELHQILELLDVVSNHTCFGADPEQPCNVENPEAFVVNWAAQLVDSVVEVGVDYLNFFALGKLVVVHNGVDFIPLSPVHEVCEHDLHLSKVELSSATEAQQVVVVEV
jgi:hypothetical protein